MKDLTKLSDTKLADERKRAFTAYYNAATHFDPDRDYSSPNQRFPELEHAIARLEAIDAEFERRASQSGKEIA